jgi:hypothetical protein
MIIYIMVDILAYCPCRVARCCRTDAPEILGPSASTRARCPPAWPRPVTEGHAVPPSVATIGGRLGAAPWTALPMKSWRPSRRLGGPAVPTTLPRRSKMAICDVAAAALDAFEAGGA